MRRLRLPSLLGPAFVALLMAATPARSKDALTPLIAAPLMPTTSVVTGTDGRQHLVYELVLTNTGTTPATIRKIEMVGDDASATVFARFEGDALLGHLRSATRAPVTTPELESGGTRLFLADFTIEPGDRPPATLLHRFDLIAAGPPGSAKEEVAPYSYTIAPIAVGTDITVLGPPLAGKHWVALNGCCEPTGVHRGAGIAVNGRLHYAQRFAIDWMRLDADARLLRGEGGSVEDYPCYGSQVLAVADGTVVATRADLVDQKVGALPDPRTITVETINGNHIVLDLGQGKYAFYAHLQKDSVRVAKGDRVKRGQVLALLGNTGNTSAPHLHFHLMDGPSVLGSSGLPYVFDRFEVSGHLPAEQFEAGGLDGVWSGGLWAQPSSRTRQFPVNLTVIDFPD